MEWELRKVMARTAALVRSEASRQGKERPKAGEAREKEAARRGQRDEILTTHHGIVSRLTAGREDGSLPQSQFRPLASRAEDLRGLGQKIKAMPEGKERAAASRAQERKWADLSKDIYKARHDDIGKKLPARHEVRRDLEADKGVR